MTELPKHFLESLAAKECVLFIGSGVSQWSALPGWEKLLLQMVDFMAGRGLSHVQANEINQMISSGDLLTAASLCSAKMRKADLRNFIDRVFIDPKPIPHRIHEIIVTLGPNSFITTNYDRLIEDAYRTTHPGELLAPINNNQPIEQARIMKYGSSQFIFTPHGRADNAESIILSREDYRKIQFDSDLIPTTLEHLFLSRPVVYIGFGLRDPDFLMIKDQIASTYKGAEREHIAIVPDASEMVCNFWRENYGIHIIPYSTIDEKGSSKGHHALLEILESAKEQLKNTGTLNVSDHSYSDKMTTIDHQEVNALIRFCEEAAHSLSSRGMIDLNLNVLFRPDLTPAEVARSIDHRRLSVSALLESHFNVAILGGPGSGKTYALQEYSRSLATKALTLIRTNKEVSALRHAIPLFLRMREYTGNIDYMLKVRLPESLYSSKTLNSGLFVFIFDGVNEIPKRFVENQRFTSDFATFCQRYSQNRFVITSRTAGYLPSLSIPIYELESPSEHALKDCLSEYGIQFSGMSSSMQSMLRNPLLLSLFIKDKGKSEIHSIADLFNSHFAAVQRLLNKDIQKISLTSLLGPIAYELMERGTQSISAIEIIDTLSAMRGVAVDADKVLRHIIASGLLVVDSEGGVGFFHQAAMEYSAARELSVRATMSNFSLTKLMKARRWDEVIVLFLSILESRTRHKLLKEIAQRDITFACQAFESATLRDKEIGTWIFDKAAQVISSKETSDTEKEDIAHALLGVTPYGRKKILIEWLDNPRIAPSAALFLTNMGAKEVAPKLVTLMLRDNTWPSDFSIALQHLGNEMIVDKLILRVLRKKGDSRLHEDNAGDVIARFENEAVRTKLAKLSKSKNVRKRSLAAAALASCKSEESRPLLASLLKDRSHDVRWKAIFHLRGAFGRKPYKNQHVVDVLFDLLRNSTDGHWAADYLLEISDSTIVGRAQAMLNSPKNEIEEINLSMIALHLSPEVLKSVLFQKLRNYKPGFKEPLANALEKVPSEKLLPELYSFFKIDDRSLHEVLTSALRSIGRHDEQLPISQQECEYLFVLWEKEQELQLPYSNLGWLLSARFQANIKPIVLRKVNDIAYPLRNELITLLAYLPLTHGDLPNHAVDWLMLHLAKKPMYERESPVARILGRILNESEVLTRLVPLLTNPNPSVRDNAYAAVRIAEGVLGKRFDLK